MKIAVFSDIHGNVEALDLIKNNVYPKVDELWFLGDLYFDYKNNEDTSKNRQILYKWFTEASKNKLKIIISGNCDNRETTNNEFFNKESKLVKEVCGLKFLLEHGHQLKEESKEKELAEFNCDVLLSGHTHLGKIQIEKDKMYLNPGSVSFPRDELNIPTYLLINEEEKTISLRSVDENELIEEITIY